ncbi:MAG: hypothetical protein HPY85_13470 [Anaerolineae bacterium]|nr:hypothetical protein [Anaerolineae bacterium]
MNEQELKKQSQRILARLFLQVAGFTVGIILLAVLAGMWIGQITGQSSTLNWLPLLVCLPINLWVTSRLSKKAVQRIARLRYPETDTPEEESEHE